MFSDAMERRQAIFDQLPAISDYWQMLAWLPTCVQNSLTCASVLLALRPDRPERRADFRPYRNPLRVTT